MKYITLLGIILYGIGYFIYISKSLKGEIKPNRVSRILRGITCLIAAFAAFSEDAWRAVVPTLIAWVACMGVVISTFFCKWAYRKLWTFDYICWGFSILAIFLRIITKQAEVAIIFSIIADLVAGIPSLKKTYYHPETESISWYLPGLINISTSFLVIETITFINIAFPMYVFLANLIFIILILRKRREESAPVQRF